MHRNVYNDLNLILPNKLHAAAISVFKLCYVLNLFIATCLLLQRFYWIVYHETTRRPVLYSCRSWEAISDQTVEERFFSCPQCTRPDTNRHCGAQNNASRSLTRPIRFVFSYGIKMQFHFMSVPSSECYSRQIKDGGSVPEENGEYKLYERWLVELISRRVKGQGPNELIHRVQIYYRRTWTDWKRGNVG